MATVGFCGGGAGRTAPVRLFRPDLCHDEDGPVSGHLSVPPNASRCALPGAIEHADVESRSCHVDMDDHYGTREATERFRLADDASGTVGTAEAFHRPDHRQSRRASEYFDLARAIAALAVMIGHLRGLFFVPSGR